MRRYASGRKSRVFCQRGGHKIAYKNLVKEPGTGYLVDKRWSDGRWNIRDHPQNFLPKNLAENQGLRYVTGDDNPKETLQGNVGIALPDGSTLIVEYVNAETTCVPVFNETQFQFLMTETSVTVIACFDDRFYDSNQVI